MTCHIFLTRSSRLNTFPQVLFLMHAWKSILKAQKFITTRAKWNIGNGCLTQIYQDNWLPSDDYGRVVSLPTLLPTGASVDLLVDEDLRW